MALPYNTLNSQMLPSIEPVVYDNVYASDALLARLRSKAKSRAFKFYDKVLQHTLQNYGGWYTGAATYNPHQTEFLTKARYTRKNMIEPYQITNDDIMDAGTPEKVLDIVAARTKNAQLRMQTGMQSAIYDSATSAGAEGNGPTGLPDFCQAADPVTWYVGGIQVADMSAWNGVSYGMNTTAFGIGNGTYVKLTAAKLRYMIDQATQGAGSDLTGDMSITDMRPTLIITTWPIFGLMRSWCAAKQNFNFEGKTANYGFQMMSFEGIDVMASNYLTTNYDKYLYILNENVYGMVVYPGWDMKMAPIHPNETGTYSLGQVLWSGAIYCWDRARLAVCTDIDASA